MSLSISSFFRSKAQATLVNSVIRRFTFNGSDVSARVTEFAELGHDVNDFITGEYVLEVENVSGTFNSLYLNKTQFYKSGIFEYGFATEAGSEDMVQLFGGVLTKASMKGSSARLHFRDKLTLLTEKKIGDDKNHVAYTASNYNPADLAWYLITSYGGLSTVKSTSNPDVDYPTWESWYNGFAGDSVVVQGYFKGETVAEALEKIARLTDSSIYDEGDNKVDFARWTAVSTAYLTITDSHIIGDVELSVTGNELVNHVDVLINYNTSSDTWGGLVTRVNTDSVNSYGEHKETYDDTTVWFVNSAAAINQAERIVFRRKEPNLVARAVTPLCFIDANIGDVIYMTSRVHSFDQKIMTLTKYSVDVNKNRMVLDIDEGFGRSPGKMTGLTLDDPYWGLLDQSYNALF